MKITSLVENTSKQGFSTEHGLSLFIETDRNNKILFDMGQGNLFTENAEKLGLSLEETPIAVVSHGHYDHGGGLGKFLEINTKAKVYIHEKAFEPHYSMKDTGLKYIGLDTSISTSPQLIRCHDTTSIDSELTLFSDVKGNLYKPYGNRLLYGPKQSVQDNFIHEQNLIIEEGAHLILIAGCAHTGILNILKKATEISGKTPTHVIAGMHLMKSGLEPKEEKEFISQLAHQLLLIPNCQYYTMHCTGIEQFKLLKEMMGARISYLACGDTITF